MSPDSTSPPRAPSKVLVTGGAGMLGSQVLLCAPDGVTAIGTDNRAATGVDRPGVDLAEPADVARLFAEEGPFSGVIHTAAYTAVDKAEAEEALALRANGTACGVLAEACARAAVPLVLVSTDFVFDGTGSRPYRPDDPPNPLSAYGRTKLAGEQAALAVHADGTRIVRTQWLYGPRGRHFPGTMRRLARSRAKLVVVADQTGSPTSTLELAPALWDVLVEGREGIYHAACEGACTWYDLAVATLSYSGIEDVTVEPCTTAEYPSAAPRPEYSVLDCSRLTELRGAPLAPWEDALKTYLGSEAQ
ncbi:MAG: dTDP-4-dehydrorhamnose reductase [Planctomycetota bacterium]|nr:MAG: dTDP-4-dehydrorhamnose reductase [Planctomycetota bacterium]